MRAKQVGNDYNLLKQTAAGWILESISGDFELLQTWPILVAASSVSVAAVNYDLCVLCYRRHAVFLITPMDVRGVPLTYRSPLIKWPPAMRSIRPMGRQSTMRIVPWAVHRAAVPLGKVIYAARCRSMTSWRIGVDRPFVFHAGRAPVCRSPWLSTFVRVGYFTVSIS